MDSRGIRIIYYSLSKETVILTLRIDMHSADALFNEGAGTPGRPSALASEGQLLTLHLCNVLPLLHGHTEPISQSFRLVDNRLAVPREHDSLSAMFLEFNAQLGVHNRTGFEAEHLIGPSAILVGLERIVIVHRLL